MSNSQLQLRARNNNFMKKQRSRNKYNNNKSYIPRNKLSKYTPDTLYYFKRHVDLGDLTIANSINTYSSFRFQFRDMPNATEFTSLFDQYKITGVKITFLPQQTQSVSIGTINNPNASSRFFSAIDYNDNNPPTSIDELREYQTCQYTPILKTHTRYIPKPKILDTNGFAISPWMSTDSANVNYFGLKVAVEPMDSTSTLSMMYTVEATYYLVFKQVK